MRLNLGGGTVPLPGYVNVDRREGREVYPLDYPDGSVDEIRASHILEHFSHREVAGVLKDWVRALKPGGRLAIAVPDFEIIARQYLAGAPMPVESFVMGGHEDGNDHHGALFDEEQLRDLMTAAGLVGIQRWQSRLQDCAALPISLNLFGHKPPEAWPKVTACMSTPRLGFMDNFFCSYQALMPLRIKFRKVTGAFWGPCLTRAIEQCIEEDAPEYVLTMDYDTVFTRWDVEALLFTAMQHPEVDALAPLQASRSKSTALFTLADETGAPRSAAAREEFAGDLVRARTAHFGLTLLKVSALQDMPKPWFYGQPDPEGRWGEERVDDDIAFWRTWEEAGKTLYLAPRVAVGHAELMVRWPNRDLVATYQHPNDFVERGKPDDVWR